MGDIFQVVIGCINISYMIIRAANNKFSLLRNDLMAGETFTTETVEYCYT